MDDRFNGAETPNSLTAAKSNLYPSTTEEFNTKKADLKYVDSDGIGAKVLMEFEINTVE